MQHIVVAAADVAALSCTLRLRLDQLDARSLLFCLTHLALPLSLFSRSLSSAHVERMWNQSSFASAPLQLRVRVRLWRRALVVLGRKISTQFRMQLECCCCCRCGCVDCAVAANFH